MDCGRPARIQAAGWTSAILAAGLAGVYLSTTLLPGTAGLASAAASAASTLAGAAATLLWGSRRASRLAEMCAYCREPPVYWPRRSSYTCRGPGDAVLCYNYAVDRFYAVSLVEYSVERLPLWRGAAFYCVRLLRGRLVEEGGVSVYEGRLASLTWRRGLLAVGSGRAVWADASRGVRVVLDALEE